MSNFKTGDKVRRVSPVTYGTKRTTGIQKDGSYTVGEAYERGITLEESYQRTFTFRASYFELEAAIGGDDGLPPAPESVRYNDEYPDRTAYKQTWLDVKRCTRRIYLESGQYGTGHGVGMEISPEAALQLAHDLRRMAMSIKRKEKQNG